MSEIEAAKLRYLGAKRDVENCNIFRKAIFALQQKADSLQELLPKLNEEIELGEELKRDALDSFVLKSDVTTETKLKKARVAYDERRKAKTETGELIEACLRALKRQEQEIVRLSMVCDLAKRQCWQAVFREIKSVIPENVFDSIQRLFVCGSQCGQTRGYLLECLFPGLNPDKLQEIRAELTKEYRIES